MVSKNVYIWYTKKTHKTAKELAKELDVSCGTTVPKNGCKFVISWGKGGKIKKSECDTVEDILNSPKSIMNNTNKLKSLEIMKKENVNVPEHYSSGDILTAINNRDITYPIIGRKFNHQGGSGFYFCRTRIGINSALRKGADYFLKYIPIEDEYRLHIFNDRIIRAVKKIPGDNCKSNLVRTHTRGWVFEKEFVNDLPSDLKQECRNAVEALDLNFGAVDVIVDTNNVPYILEVNTGPSLEGVTLDLYTKNIQKLIKDVKEDSDNYF